MPAGLDSAAVLRALADHPDAFPALRGDVAEFARKAMVKQLKDKGLTLDGLRGLARACGEEAVAAVLDGWEAAELAGLARKADAHGPHGRGTDAAAARRHLLDLAAGRAEAGAKPEKAAKAAKEAKASAAPKAAGEAKERKVPKSKIGGVLQSKVHSGAARPARPRKASA